MTPGAPDSFATPQKSLDSTEIHSNQHVDKRSSCSFTDKPGRGRGRLGAIEVPLPLLKTASATPPLLGHHLI